MMRIRRYEIPLLIIFYAFLAAQFTFKPTLELLIVPILAYGALIWGYVAETQKKSISVALVLSTSILISVYLTAKGFEARIWFNIVGKLSFGLIAILLFVEANKLKNSLSEISYSMTLGLSFVQIVAVFSPRLIFNSFETTWLNYIIFMLAAHVYIAERQSGQPTLTNQLKVILIIKSVSILADLHKMLPTHR